MQKKTYEYNKINCILSSVIVFAMISSLGLFLTFILLLTTNSQFIAFNEFSATGKFPALFYYIAIILSVTYCGMFFISLLAIWFTADILNKWSRQTSSVFVVFKVAFAFTGLIQLIAGIITIVYTKTMALPLREYMADNLRSNYTGGYGMGYLERQFDRYVDWVQINYQCCGVVSYEDYRNGFYYNSFNKYTIVNIVPSSCCMYREGTNTNQLAASLSQLTQQSQSAQASVTSKCQMKSINIYRKGCYDILMWWMESFGLMVASLTFIFGTLDIFVTLVCLNIFRQIRLLKELINEKNEKMRIKMKKNNFRQFNHRTDNDENDPDDTATTINESISYVMPMSIESKT